MSVLDKRATGLQREIPHHPRVKGITVQDVLARRPSRHVGVDPQLSLLAAVRLMHELNRGAVVVAEGDCIWGAFSEHDFARMAARVGKAALNMPVGEAVIRDDAFVSPDDSAQFSLQLMAERTRRFLPVKQGGKLIDMLSADELLDALVAQYEKIIKAKELDQQVLFLRGTYSC